MATCKDCIHEKLCVIKAFPDAFENTEWSKKPCDHFKPIADVAPKSEVDKWQKRCREWHEVAELKSKRVVELEAELSKSKAEVAREIFEQINGFFKRYTKDKNYYMDDIENDIAKLKKQYTEADNGETL